MTLHAQAKAELRKRIAAVNTDTPEQAAIAAESRAAYQAEWAAGVRAEQAQRERVTAAARDPSELERQGREAGLELATAKMESGQVDPADLEAQVAAAETVARAARTAFDIVQVRAQAAQVRAMGDAGPDPVARAKAVAKAQIDWAEAVGNAEADHEAACLDLDRKAIAAFRARQIANHRIRAAEARLAERAKGESDPLRLSNPFADPIRPVITESQYRSIRDPELKARAGREANIIPDDDPKFTRDDAVTLLRARGSGRDVLTRAELAALSPQDQAKAARSAIIVD